MTNTLPPRMLPVVLPLLVMVGCTGIPSASDSATKTGDTSACLPVARGGEDQSAALSALVTLDGSASTDCDLVDETTLVYAWSLVSAPVDSAASTADLVLDGEDPAKVGFTPDVAGTYVAQLIVTDARGVESAPDLVVITIAGGNTPPIADCGQNQTANVGDRVGLDGSGSSDPDGTVTGYSWSLASVPTCSTLTGSSIYDGAQVSASMVPDCAGVFVVGLAVTDGMDWSDASYCTVTVASGNATPVADAGESGTLSPCTPASFELNGFGSYDPEGATLTYTWALLEAPPGSSASDANFNDTSLANPTFRWDVVGAYVFQLQVSDGELASPPDVVTYTFQDEGDNNPPIANAGLPQSITFNADCTTQSYAWACEECPLQDVEVDGSGSTDLDGDNLDYAWSEATGEITFSARTSAITTAYMPAMSATVDVTNTRVWDVNLTVRDCVDESSATVAISYNCFGERSF